MSDLNKKRLQLSNQLMDLTNELQAVTTSFIDSLTMKQYQVYQSFHLKVGCLSADQLSKIARSNKIKTLALKAYVLQERAFKVNAELDTVLNSMYNSWELVNA